MNEICIAEQSVSEKTRELKYSVIWAALWIVALMSLLMLPALGR